jgi:hypothetical protein
MSRTVTAFRAAFLAAGILGLGGLAAQAEPPSAPAPAAPKAPEFKVKDLDGKERTLAEFAGKWVVIEWTNYSCPFVKKHYNTVPGAAASDPAKPGNIPALQAKYGAKGVVWLSVCSSGLKADGTPKEGYMEVPAWKEAMKARMAQPTAVLLDRDGAMGKAYAATRTPEVFVVCPKGTIQYRGAIDDQDKANSNPAEAKSYLSEALDAALAGQPLPRSEVKAYGCTIKWAE